MSFEVSLFALPKLGSRPPPNRRFGGLKLRLGQNPPVIEPSAFSDFRRWFTGGVRQSCWSQHASVPVEFLGACLHESCAS